MARPEENDLVEPDLEAYEEQSDTKDIDEVSATDLGAYVELEGQGQDPDAPSEDGEAGS